MTNPYVSANYDVTPGHGPMTLCNRALTTRPDPAWNVPLTLAKRGCPAGDPLPRAAFDENHIEAFLFYRALQEEFMDANERGGPNVSSEDIKIQENCQLLRN